MSRENRQKILMLKIGFPRIPYPAGEDLFLDDFDDDVGEDEEGGGEDKF